MLVVDEVTTPTLRALGRAFAIWRKSTPEPPLLISRTEWTRASDAFPIEITDMRASYQVLAGPTRSRESRWTPATCAKRWNESSGASCSGSGRVMRPMLPSPAALGRLGLESAATILVLLRGVLAALGTAGSRRTHRAGRRGCGAIGFEPEQLLHVVRHRADREWRCGAPEFENYMNAVEQSGTVRRSTLAGRSGMQRASRMYLSLLTTRSVPGGLRIQSDPDAG